MSAVTSISLDDAQGTPVSHTFVPLGPDLKGVWWFEDQTGVASIGFNRISLALTRAGNPAPGSNSGDRVNRVKIGMHMPKTETLGTDGAGLTPPPTVAYIDRSITEYILPERDSLQDRKDIRKMSMNLLANAQVVAMVENLQNVY